MAYLSRILVFTLFITLINCTPDCYNTSVNSVSKKWNGFQEPLTPTLKNFRVDWFTLKPGQNCAFYTFNDIYFASFNPNLQSIYLNFLNATAPGQTKPQCALESTQMRPFSSGTWLYANSSRAPPGMCGYYVGVANSDPKEELTFQIIRFRTEGTTQQSGVTASAQLLSQTLTLAVAAFLMFFAF